MSTTLRQEFHAKVFSNLQAYLQVINALVDNTEPLKNLNNMTSALLNGKLIHQVIMDDLMNAFVFVMRNAPDDMIPGYMYGQLQSIRDGQPVDQATYQRGLDDALAKIRATPDSDTVPVPEFMVLLNESMPGVVLHNLVNNWNVMVSLFGQLLHPDYAIAAKMKADALIGRATEVQAVIDENRNARHSTLASIVGLDATPQPGTTAAAVGGDSDDVQDTKGLTTKGNLAASGVIIHEPDEIGDVDAVLNSLVGLEDAKFQIRKIRSRVGRAREMIAAGLMDKGQQVLENYIVCGPSGTGKTTFIRLIGKIYRDARLLDEGHVVECSRVSLVAGYMGQTALKTQNTMVRALNGVLFVDEAYSLFKEKDEYGPEAIEVILRGMSVYRKNLVVAFAGYKEPMNELLESNEGLSRRFNHTVEFDHFTIDQLMTIFDQNLARHGLIIGEQERSSLETRVKKIKTVSGRHFGNAGTMENIVKDLNDYLALSNDKDGIVAELADCNQTGGAPSPALIERLTRITAHEIEQVDPQKFARTAPKGPMVFVDTNTPA